MSQPDVQRAASVAGDGQNLLVVDAHSVWRRSLERALCDEGHTVTVADDEAAAEALLRDLLIRPDRAPIHAVIAAAEYVSPDELSWLASSVYQLARDCAVEVRPKIILIARGPALVVSEYIEKVSIVGIISSDEALARTVADVSRILYKERRCEVRCALRHKVHLTQAEQQYAGTMVDISHRGAQVVLSQWHSDVTLNVGEQLELTFLGVAEDGPIRCVATVRRCRNHHTLFRSRTSIGFEFTDLDELGLMQISRLVAWAREMEQLQRMARLHMPPFGWVY